jgi:2-hydroxychromene-2-carboxylate isomerase
MPEPVDFCFDYISPYAYIGWTQIHGLAKKYDREVRPVPILFAALLKHGDARGPAEIPLKRVYMGKDTIRTARVLGIPFAPPPTHPFNPLVALRVTALELLPEERRRVIDALFAATWGGGGGGVESPAAAQAALDAAGLDGASLLRAASEEPAKAKLRAETGRAIARGVFGVPTVIADGEPFWGVDSFAHLERRLAGNDPFKPEDLTAWMALTPSATRRV